MSYVSVSSENAAIYVKRMGNCIHTVYETRRTLCFYITKNTVEMMLNNEENVVKMVRAMTQVNFMR